MPDGTALTKRRILVLDPHAGSRWIVCYALSIRGHMCEAAPSLQAALVVLQTFEADVVIFDRHRDHVDSRATVASLKAASVARGRPMRLIALSVFGDPAMDREVDGVDAYFVKPVEIDEIARAVQDAGVRPDEKANCPTN